MDKEISSDRDKRPNNIGEAEAGAQASTSKKEKVVKMDTGKKNPKTTMMVQVAESLINGATNSTTPGTGLGNSNPPTPAPGSIPSMFTPGKEKAEKTKKKEKKAKHQPKNSQTGGK